MIKGIGIDIVEISRIKKIDSLDRFIDRILAKEELTIYNTFTSEARQLQFLAGRFAAKEAYSKAKGTGIGDLSFKDIVILNDHRGKPYVRTEANELVHLTITHSENYAIANVIIEHVIKLKK
jgi:holo-[acyl-carrier protein] synthase